MEAGYEGLKYEAGKFRKTEDQIVPESPLQININGEQFSVTMHSPGLELELGLGLLYSEGVIESDYKIDYTLTPASDDILQTLHFTISGDATEFTNKRSLLSVASCGICGTTELNIPEGELKSKEQIPSNTLEVLFKEMARKQHAFVKTGGSHAAAIFNKKFEMVAFAEDVGRHNAVDKIVGLCLKNKKLKNNSILLVSGRVSYEIVVKCFRAKVPILAAVSSPSSLSIDFAKELGITLVGFCRGDKFTVYSHPNRLIEV